MAKRHSNVGRSIYHRLSGVNKDAKQAVCALCGPVEVYINSRGDARCKKAVLRATRERTYGVDDIWYWSALSSQRFTCAICKRTLDSSPGHRDKHRRPHIDHDHITGKVRGLLCGWCNTAIGSLDHNTDRLKSAIAYLEEHDGL